MILNKLTYVLARTTRTRSPKRRPLPAGALLQLLPLIAGWIFSCSVMAQVPSLSLAGLPATPLIGEQFCAEVSFTNTVANTGYGPYLTAVFDPGIQQLSADFVDITPQLIQIGVFDATGMLLDPISGDMLTGIQGGSAWTVRYPIGSLDQGQPALVMTLCAVVEVGADIGVDLNVEITPGFEFGDTTVGTNGAIVGTPIASTVTPEIARISKGNSAPESERPPGPSHPFQYQWSVDISQGIALSNLLIEDSLPSQIQWTGDPISLSAPLGLGCSLSESPNAPVTPGGRVGVTCTTILGTSSPDDITVTVPVYISDILEENMPDSEAITNTVELAYDYQGTGYNASDTSTVTAVHAAVQKTVSGTGLPGGILTYVITFQLTDYPDAVPGAGSDTFIIDDVLADGLRFDGTLALVVDGSIVPITPTVSPGTGAGETFVVWDVADAVGGVLPNGANGSLTFETTILDTYDNGEPVRASDPFLNSPNLSYTLTEGGSGSDSSEAQASIQPNVADKTIVLPNPLPPVLEPGSEVVFELSLTIPAGNTSAVVLTDFLPRPVFDVADFNEANDLIILPPFSLLNPSVTTDAGTNAIRMDFGDINAVIAATLRVQLTARLVGTPFADSLFLTNLLSTSYENSDGDAIVDLQAVGTTIGAPSLTVTKGVVATNNSAAQITPAPPADPTAATADSDVGNVDAFDEITYVLTIENTGSTPAYNVTIDETPATNLSCSEPVSGDIVNGNGTSLGFTGSLAAGVLLDVPLGANDGTEGAPYADDTVLLTLRCVLSASVEPLQTIVNEAGATWTSVPDSSSPFPRVTDTAQAVISQPLMTKIIEDTIQPGYARRRTAHIGEIATYQLNITIPEGTSSNVRLQDTLPSGLAFVDVISVTANSTDLTSSEGSFTDVENNAGFLAQGGGATAPDRRLVFGPTGNATGFGTLTNSNSDNTSDEIITVRYRSRVLNAAVNTSGARRRNRARLFWQASGEPNRRIQVRALPLRIVEASLQLNKVFTPDEGDDSTPPRVSLTLAHANGSATDAFDIALSDVLPLNMFVDGLVDDSLCSALPDNLNISASATSGSIDATWGSFAQGATCTLSFDTRFAVAPAAGAEINNCAEVFWESLLDADQGALATPPSNTLGVERTGSDGDPGELNNYRVEACDTFRVFDVGISKRVSATNQAHTDNIVGTPADTESLTVGETVTFELVVTIPDANVPQLEVTDLLPITSNVLRLISARTISVGDDLDAGDPDPTAVIDDRDGDGVADRAVLDYGPIVQASDGTTDEEDRIRIEVVAKVLDELVNRNNDLTSNAALVAFLPGLTASDNQGLEIVEPLLGLQKTADRTEVEAGNTVLYTLRIAHTPASRIDAKDFALSDLVPAELNVNPSSVVVGQVCTDPPDTGPLIAAGTLSAAWTTFPLAAVCEIQFSAEVDISAIIGQTITNESEIVWTSLASQGDDDDRLYELRDSWSLSISEPGLSKAITATDQDSTPFVFGAPSQELTIGETATFTVTAEFPDGTTEQTLLFDQLPQTDVLLRVTRAELISIGGDLMLSSGILAGDGGFDCTGGTPQQCAAWIIGNVVNQPDNRPTPDADDSLIFEIEAIVVDDPLNSGAPGKDKNLLNTATLESLSLQLESTASFDIVEPLLEISKLTENGTLPAIVVAGGPAKRFTLRINHLPESTATANTLVINDTLDSDILWDDDNTVVSDCPGFAIDPSSPDAGFSGIVRFTVDSLSLAQGSCEIAYDVRAQPLLPVLGRYTNTAELTWESAPGSPESRSGSSVDSNALVSLSTATLSKVVTGTSVPDTGSSAGGNPMIDDLTIGEEINYRIVVAFSEGTTDNVQIVDTLPAIDPDGPALEFVSGTVISIGANLSTSESGVPDIDPANVITIDYGTVENVGDSALDADDTIVYELVARVIDLPNNLSGTILTNQVDLSFAGGSESTSVDVEVVEPELGLTKQFTDLTDGVATIELTVENTGNAAAYELTITDIFNLNDAFWIPNSLVPISVPTGFTLTETSAGGPITVTLETEGNPARPEEVLAPGETLSLSFSMELVNGGIVGEPQIDNTAEAEATSLPGVSTAERVYSDSATDSLLFPALSLEKIWTGPNNPARPGDTLTYTLTLENTGPAAATDIVVTDVPDAIGTFEAGSVAASGASTVTVGNTPGDTSVTVTFTGIVATAGTETISYNVLVPIPYPDGMSEPQRLSNQAEADTKEQLRIVSDDPGTPALDDATVVPIEADPIMRVSKDDQVLLTAPGAVIEYLIEYANAGDQDATGVEITETVPANTIFRSASSTPGWSCSDGSAPGALCVFTVGNVSSSPGSVVFAVQVDNPLAAGVMEINNDVNITDDGIEFDSGEATVPSTDSANQPTPIGGAFPQLDVQKDDGGIGVAPGQRYSYLIEYANIGNRGATGVVLTETVPDDVTFSAVASLPSRWSCPNGSPPGTVCSFTIPLLPAQSSDQAVFGLDVVFPAAAGRDLIVNTVEIGDDGSNSPTAATDSDMDNTPLIAVPDIYVSKTTDASIVQEDDTIVYTAAYGNRGDQNATGVIVREAVPEGATFNAAESSPAAWSCANGAPAGTICTYMGGSVDAGFMETLLFAIDIVSTPGSGQLVNIIEANDDGGNGLEPTPDNNLDRVINLFRAVSIDTMSDGLLLLMALAILYLGVRHRGHFRSRR